MIPLEPLSWRSLLFVPATRPDRFAKALASGADAVCVDLEDAVAADRKDDARAAAIAFLSDATPEAVRVIRINSPRTLDGLRDLLALSQRKPGPAVVAVPKIASPDEVAWLLELLPDPDLRFIVQIETLRGIRNAVTITAASPRICAVMFGGLDLAAEIGVPPSWEALLQARSAVAYASAEVGLPALDMPFVNVSDPEGCLAEGRRSRSLGFTAKMAIHPAQIRPIHEAFAPDEVEVRAAERMLDAFRRAGGGVALLDGKMIERPVIRNAERLLARAGR